MKARDIMTKTVRTVTLTTPVRKIAALLVSRRISAVPVIDKNGHVLGIVTEGDLLRRTEAGTEYRRSWWADLLGDPGTRAREYVKSHGGHARDVMTRSVVCVGPMAEVADIAQLMEKRGIKRVPVVKGGRLAGIVSRADVLRAVAKARPAKRVKISDAELHERLTRKLSSQLWGVRNMVNFVVEGGKVELFGLVRSVDQKEAVRVLAENTAGVRSVSDRLALMPRLSAG